MPKVKGEQLISQLKLSAKWTDDCQGKKDYDANIIELSTRYWPSGGGFTLLNANTGEWQENEDRPYIKPSAKANIIIRHGNNNYIDLATFEVEANTEEEVKAAVEKWAAKQFEDITSLLITHYDKDNS